MKISNIHQTFSNQFENQRALSNPEDFLGPNWKDVLNFWLYLDTLETELIHMDIFLRYKLANFYSTHFNDLKLAKVDSRMCAFETIDEIFAAIAWGQASVTVGYVVGYATWELIGAHKLLEQGKTLTFVPVLLDVCHFKS
jgi:hypothetical protein